MGLWRNAIAGVRIYVKDSLLSANLPIGCRVHGILLDFILLTANSI